MKNTIADGGPVFFFFLKHYLHFFIFLIQFLIQQYFNNPILSCFPYKINSVFPQIIANTVQLFLKSTMYDPQIKGSLVNRPIERKWLCITG
jgi:hypothetical protein